ncbi:hypothetical protein [Bacillus sp. FJAT-26390]|uniref:hypothetical protein n=1 Tax=Bacillus sp. FJAT-26390 TaxID=1743142 RepID=UPI000807B24C|nr:hypothetical protein [Bacillus sp. FJAT-26390]OBZ11383.1 hypothetical protein A7975_20835 [Bacillus sp. FJAT-26390]
MIVKNRKILIIILLLVVLVSSVLLAFNWNKLYGMSNEPATEALSNFLEGVKNRDATQVVDNIKDNTFKDQESLVAFYTKDIEENRLIDYKILDVTLVDSTHAEALTELNVSTMNEVKQKFNLIEENGKWLVYLNNVIPE